MDPGEPPGGQLGRIRRSPQHRPQRTRDLADRRLRHRQIHTARRGHRRDDGLQHPVQRCLERCRHRPGPRRNPTQHPVVRAGQGRRHPHRRPGRRTHPARHRRTDLVGHRVDLAKHRTHAAHRPADLPRSRGRPHRRRPRPASGHDRLRIRPRRPRTARRSPIPDQGAACRVPADGVPQHVRRVRRHVPDPPESRPAGGAARPDVARQDPAWRHDALRRHPVQDPGARPARDLPCRRRRADPLRRPCRIPPDHA